MRSPPPNEQYESDRYEHSETKCFTSLRSTIFEGAEPMVYRIGCWLDTHNGAVTGIATVFLAIITGWLVFVARDQSNTTREQLRAYVFISDVKVLQFPNVPHITATYKNFGQTPCDEMTLSFNAKVAEVPLTKKLCIWAAVPMAPLAPGHTCHSDVLFGITQEQRSGI